MIFLPLPPKCLGYRLVLPCPVYVVLKVKSSVFPPERLALCQPTCITSHKIPTALKATAQGETGHRAETEEAEFCILLLSSIRHPAAEKSSKEMEGWVQWYK